jgi:xylan 1,4-beta-xylosidase
MESGNPSFIGKRQQHLYCTTETELDFSANSEEEKAGLTIFQDEHHFYLISKSIDQNKPVIQLYKSSPAGKEMELLSQMPLAGAAPVKLRITAEGGSYSFYFSNGPGWQLLKEKLDAKFLSTKEAGGFIGCLFGMYATSSGEKTANSASFKYLKYTGNDPMFGKVSK